MKIAYGSDLHFEFGIAPPSFKAVAGVDVLVLAGDIVNSQRPPHRSSNIIDYAAECSDALTAPVVVVLGNHEFYDQEYHQCLADCRAAAEKHCRVHLLENDQVVIDGVRFLGCVLWSDFEAYSTPLESKIGAQKYISDYSEISYLDSDEGLRRLRPGDTYRFNQGSRQYLHEKLAEPFDGKTVVVTHFPPVPMSAPQYEGDLLTPYFCNNWSEDIDNGLLSPDIWIAGHTHHSCEFQIGKTHVVSRQGGYPGELERFEWASIVV